MTREVAGRDGPSGPLAGEDALRSRIPELSARGVSLVVVSGDVIEGTITPKLMERRSPGLLETRRRQAGRLPTVDDFARAVADAAERADLESGATVFVGSTEWEIPDTRPADGAG